MGSALGSGSGSRSGSIPENFAAEMAKRGAALNASFGRPVASGAQAMRATMAASPHAAEEARRERGLADC